MRRGRKNLQSLLLQVSSGELARTLLFLITLRSRGCWQCSEFLQQQLHGSVQKLQFCNKLVCIGIWSKDESSLLNASIFLVKMILVQAMQTLLVTVTSKESSFMSSSVSDVNVGDRNCQGQEHPLLAPVNNVMNVESFSRGSFVCFMQLLTRSESQRHVNISDNSDTWLAKITGRGLSSALFANTMLIRKLQAH